MENEGRIIRIFGGCGVCFSFFLLVSLSFLQNLNNYAVFEQLYFLRLFVLPGLSALQLSEEL